VIDFNRHLGADQRAQGTPRAPVAAGLGEEIPHLVGVLGNFYVLIRTNLNAKAAAFASLRIDFRFTGHDKFIYLS